MPDPTLPQAPPTPEFEYLPGVQNALGILGGNAESVFQNILNANLGESYLQGLLQNAGNGPIQFGTENVRDLLGSGNITAGHRGSFLNTILGIQFPNAFNSDYGIINEGPFAGMFGNIPTNIQNSLLGLIGQGGTPGDGGGGGGGGGHGGGFGGGGAFDLGGIPNFDLINSTIAEYLNGERPLEPFDIESLPPELRAQLGQTISTLLDAQGLPQHIIDAAENSISSRLKTAETETQRLALDRAAGRGIGDSGLANRAEYDISQNFGQTLAEQLSDLHFRNALEAAEQQGLGIRGAGLLSQIGLGEQQLGYNAAIAERGQDLNALSSAIAAMLGMGDLELRSILGENQFQQQEFLNNLLLGGLFGSGGASNDPLTDLEDLLGGIQEPTGDDLVPTGDIDPFDFLPSYLNPKQRYQDVRP